MEQISKRFQQSPFWVGFKCAHGWSSVMKDGVAVLCRTFPLGPLRLSVAYIPLAPELRDGESLEDFVGRISAFASGVRPLLPGGTLLARFDLPLDFGGAAERDAARGRIRAAARAGRVPLKKARVDVQPPDSVLLDLSKTEDELLSSMRAKWRYNIRYAAKRGVLVRAVSRESGRLDGELASFYRLYRATAERDGIGIHPLAYYRDLLLRSEAGAKVTLYIASHEGNDLAAIITLFTGDEAVYLYGCSGNEKRNLMPAYLAQWTAIRDAKAFGSKVYDFYGIPPTGDEKHPMHGLYLFKTGFGGTEVHRPGSFDVPFSPLHRLYALAEAARAWYHKKLMKRIRGR